MLATKNRQAQELRSQAEHLRTKLADATVSMTQDEVNTTLEGIRSLEIRANAVAEFTPDAEVQRQGGSDGVTRVDSIEAAGDSNRSLSARTIPEELRTLASEARHAFGDVRGFLHAVTGRNTSLTDSQKRFMERAKLMTRTITGDTNGGEFLLPLTQVQEIFSLENVQLGIMQDARIYNVPGRSLRIPYLIQDEGTNTLDRPTAGKIANVTIVGEGATKPVREPSFGQRLLTVYKWAAITQVSDELMGDDFTGELPAEFTNAVGQQTMNAINEYCTIDGTGTGQPTGALYPGAWNIEVARATATTITAPDVFKMYQAHTHGPRSYWLASRRTMATLFALQTTNNTMVTFLQNLNDAPTMMLLGLPVRFTDLLPTLGQRSDIALINPDFYAMAMRQALTVESSRDYAFVNDLTTYRFVARAGGIPINTGTYAYKFVSGAKVDEHSPFVVLDVPAS
jgi:HK97 family phage major capsid protein